MPPYRQRPLDTPDLEWLSAEEAAAWLGLETTVFEDRVELGVLPPGSHSTLRAGQWHWQTVLAMSFLRPWLDRLYVRRKKTMQRRKRLGRKPQEGRKTPEKTTGKTPE